MIIGIRHNKHHISRLKPIVVVKTNHGELKGEFDDNVGP